MIDDTDAAPNGHDDGEATQAPSKPAKRSRKAKGTGKPAKAAKPPKATPRARKAPVEKDQFGYRSDSMKSKAAALYSQDGGATLEQVKAELGSVQLNVLKELEGKGHKVNRTKENGEGSRQVTRYHLSA